MNFIVAPIFFLSGALFPLSDISPTLRVFINLNPLTYGVDGIRGTLTFNSHINIFWDFGVVFLVMAVLFAIGTYMFSKTEA